MSRATRSGIALIADMLIFASAMIAAGTLAGCDRKETILEVKTPNKEVEVEQDRDTGRVEVNVERDR